MKQLIPLSSRARAIIFGGLLGDGSLKLHANYRNARFSFRHSAKQRNYFLWKASELKEIAGKQSVWVQGKDKPDGWGGEKLRFQSSALPALTEIFKLTHRGGKFQIRRKWLNQLTPLSLATWWMDDGSLVSNSRKGVLCTDGFSAVAVQLLSKYLKKVWQIETSIHEVAHRGQYRLHLRSTEQVKRLLKIILPHIFVQDMLAKVLLLYKDSQLQQRWISEVVQLTGFPHFVVMAEYEKKKARSNYYR